jgi:hypothetical protein
MLSVETTQLSFVYQAALRDVSIENATRIVREVVPDAQVQEKTTETLPKNDMTWSKELYVGSNTMIALTVVGGVVFVVVLILIYCCCKRKVPNDIVKKSDVMVPSETPSKMRQPLVIPISIENTKYK